MTASSMTVMCCASGSPGELNPDRDNAQLPRNLGLRDIISR
jgi:hypothetical protein